MAVQAIDLQIDDVEAATKLLAAACRWLVLSDDADFGELDAGGVRVMLSRDAMVPWGKLAGVMLHHSIDDVPVAIDPR